VMQSKRKALSSQFDQQHIEGLPGSPTAAEARYFRTLEHLKLVEASLRHYVSLWALASWITRWVLPWISPYTSEIPMGQILWAVYCYIKRSKWRNSINREERTGNREQAIGQQIGHNLCILARKTSLYTIRNSS
jgi:hypothetical protein